MPTYSLPSSYTLQSPDTHFPQVLQLDYFITYNSKSDLSKLPVQDRSVIAEGIRDNVNNQRWTRLHGRGSVGPQSQLFCDYMAPVLLPPTTSPPPRIWSLLDNSFDLKKAGRFWKSIAKKKVCTHGFSRSMLRQESKKSIEDVAFLWSVPSYFRLISDILLDDL